MGDFNMAKKIFDKSSRFSSPDEEMEPPVSCENDPLGRQFYGGKLVLPDEMAGWTDDLDEIFRLERSENLRGGIGYVQDSGPDVTTAWRNELSDRKLDPGYIEMSTIEEHNEYIKFYSEFYREKYSGPLSKKIKRWLSRRKISNLPEFDREYSIAEWDDYIEEIVYKVGFTDFVKRKMFNKSEDKGNFSENALKVYFMEKKKSMLELSREEDTYVVSFIKKLCELKEGIDELYRELDHCESSQDKDIMSPIAYAIADIKFALQFSYIKDLDIPENLRPVIYDNFKRHVKKIRFRWVTREDMYRRKVYSKAGKYVRLNDVEFNFGRVRCVQTALRNGLIKSTNELYKSM